MAEQKVDPGQPAPGPDLDAIRSEAVKAERERVTAILKLAHSSQHELAVKLASDGADLLGAVNALYEGLKAMCDQLLATIAAYTAENAPAEEGEEEEGGAPFEEKESASRRKPVGPPRPAFSATDPEAQFKAEFARNPEAQKRMKESTYVKMRIAEESGRVKGEDN